MKNLKKYPSFGEQLRNMREGNGLTLKTVAEKLTIDISLLAKIERNERQPTRLILNQIANYFNVDEKSLHLQIISDQIATKVINEDIDVSILKVAEEKVKYLKNAENGK